MNLKIFPHFFVLFTILTSIKVSLAIVGVYSKELGARLCIQQLNTNINCGIQLNNEVFAKMMIYNSFPNITTPHVRVIASEGFFNVRFQDGLILPQVQFLFKVAETIEFDINLMNTSADLYISCLSYGSLSKMSSDIIKSSENLKLWQNIDQADQWPLILDSRYEIHVPEQNAQSGHFTCRSIHERRHGTQTIRIFTQPTGKLGLSPFVLVRESTIQGKEIDGFTVPCRTNYRLETAPDLLWKNTEEDNFTAITADDMKSFRWNPRVGFQFNSSVKMWEMKILACRLGDHEKVFLPTPSRFINLYAVKLEENNISCGLVTRNDSMDPALQSKLNLIQTGFLACLMDLRCDLEWELNNREDGRLYSKVSNTPSKFQLTVSGLLLCSFEHIYERNRVPETSYRKFFTGLDSKLYLLPGHYPNLSVIQISQVDRPLYKSDTELYFEFTCKVVDFVRTNLIVNFILRHNDTIETFSRQEIPRQASSSTAKFNVTLYTNITHAICSVLTTEGTFVSAEVRLHINDASAPFIEPVESNKRTFKVGNLNDNQTLVCPITGAPEPTYQWIMDGKRANLVQGTTSRNLTFRQINENIAGTYTCEARNGFGNISFDFQVSVQSQGFFSTLSPTTILWIGIGTFFGLIGFSVATIFALKYFRAKHKMRNITPQEAIEFLNGITVAEGASNIREGCELALNMPFTKRIDSKGLVIARDSVLGRGQYGIVYRGILDAQAVAVKTFKRTVTYDEFRAALVEVKLMGFVGDHPNIVRFVGADVSNIEKRDILIVMELSPIGSLENHLKVIQPSTQIVYVNDTKSHYATVEEVLVIEKLFGFCEQIALAMEYLETRKVIHGDLAARNVLVFSHGVVKVTDFGYSRQLYENSMYKPTKNRSLPWRSAAIELLRNMEFSTESDIWAFGVTIWEIFTFGNTPFGSHRYSDQFVDALVNGLRLQKPSGLSESQYSFLKECWNVNKTERPRFSALKSFFLMEKTNLRRCFENIVE